ncbi:MAG: choice-of-anchor D domain-containing protein [Sulfuricellaceae bacterium]
MSRLSITTFLFILLSGVANCAQALNESFTLTQTNISRTLPFTLADDANVTIKGTSSALPAGWNSDAWLLDSGNNILYGIGSSAMFRFLPSGAGDLFDYAGPYPLKAGSYFLKIECSACRLGAADNVSYNVSLDLASPSRAGDTEPNDTVAQALTPGVTATGHIGYSNASPAGGSRDDQDLWSFNLASAGKATVTFKGDATLGYLSYIKLEPENGVYLASANVTQDASGQWTANLAVDNLPAGKYLVRVVGALLNDALGVKGGFGGYELLVGSTASAAPRLELGSSALPFGNQEVNSASAAQTLTLRNSGGTAANLYNILTSGDFTVKHNCPAALSPGADCTLNVSFTPSATGSHTGALTINSDAGVSSVALSGVGIVTMTGNTWSITSTNQGAGSSDVKLVTVFAPSPTERNGSYNLYFAGLYSGQWYFVTLQNWQMKIAPYGGGDFPAYIAANGAELYADKPGGGSEAQTWSLVLGDLSGLHGLEIYAGFGRSANDMLAKSQVKMIYRID